MDGAILRPGDWFERVRDGWRWWLAELAGLVPVRLRRAVSTADDAILIAAGETEFVVSRRNGADEQLIARVPLDNFAARALRLAVPATRGPALLADPVILQLPADGTLNRTLTLPGGARRNLGDILRHEIARHSPISAQDIYYDYRILGRVNGTLTIGLRIVRREGVDAAIQTCADAGISLAAVAFGGDGARAEGGTFPVDAQAARNLRLRPRLVPALAGLVLVLAIGLVGSMYLRSQAVADDLAARVESARSRVAVVETLQRRLDAANRQAVFLSRQKASPAAIAVLATVARLLPDDAWLYQFEINGDEVRLHGFSTSAASLIALFDASPYFRDAEMRSPLMQGPNNATQRFDIVVKLRSPGP